MVEAGVQAGARQARYKGTGVPPVEEKNARQAGRNKAGKGAGPTQAQAWTRQGVGRHGGIGHKGAHTRAAKWGEQCHTQITQHMHTVMGRVGYRYAGRSV